MKRIYIILLLSITMASCFKNRGNYDYNIASTIDIDAILEDVEFPNAYVYEEYNFTPPISDSLKELFYFRWEEDNADTTVIICEGATLNFTPQTMATHTFNLVAIDKIYETYYTNSSASRVQIDVDGEGYINQWFVLGEVDGVEGLSTINPTYKTEIVDGEETLVRDFVVNLNVNTSLPAGMKSLTMGFANNYLDNDIGGYTPDNAYLLETNDNQYWLSNDPPYNVFSTLKDNIVDADADFEYSSFFHLDGKGLLIDKNGTTYRKIGAYLTVDCHYHFPYHKMQHYHLDGTPIKILRVMDRNWENSSYYYYHTLAELQYDDPALPNYGQRFIGYINSGNNFAMEQMSAEPSYMDATIEESVDFNNLGNWEIVYGEWYNYLNNMVMFKKDNEVKFTFVNKLANMTTYMRIYTRDFPNPEIFNDPDLKIISQETFYLFFASGNMIYRYIYSNNSFEPYYSSIPSGEKITALSMNNTERQLLVGTASGAIYVIDVTRDLELTDESKLMGKIEGFSRIIDIDYKYKDYLTARNTGYSYSSSYAD